MRGLLAPLVKTQEFRILCQGLDKKYNIQQVFGLSGSLRSYTLAGLTEYTGGSALIITGGEQDAAVMAEDLAALLPGTRVLHFPVQALLPYQVLAQNRDIAAARLKVLEGLADGQRMIVTATVEALLRGLTPFNIYKKSGISIRVGDTLAPALLAREMLGRGYERVDMVEGPGQFSSRGGIMDVYPMTSTGPYRIDFFDDEIASLRRFHLDTQKSLEKVNNFYIFPCTELFFDSGTRQQAVKLLETEYRQQLKNISRGSSSEVRQNLMEMAERVLQNLGSGTYFPGLEQYLPYFYPKAGTLLDYLPPASLLLFDEPIRLKEIADVVQRERNELYTGLLSRGKVFPGQCNSYGDWKDLGEGALRHRAIYTSLLPRQTPGVSPQNLVTFSVKSMHSFLGRLDILTDEVRSWKRSGYAVALLAGNRDRAEQLLSVMRDSKIEAYQVSSLANDIYPGSVAILEAGLSGGFELVAGKLAVIAESELYGRQRKPRRTQGRVAGKMEPFTDLKKGDYIVHVNHGIGRYLGIVTLDIAGIQKDYLQIKYSGEDKLYVPTDQVGLIQKYLGSEAEAPRLSRLGGAEWSRVKGKVREAVKEMAQELLALYAARESAPGHVFQPDTVWQKEFEANFPYEETLDQLKCIADVKRDMERSRSMDRLLCGDVGYGKTEVALRAAFKAVMDNKQVAVLVPTTILAQQHYNTFKERFARYPVTIEMLSRFRNQREQRAVIKDLRLGKVDIVIGTHRLVQDDVIFKDLGLLVVDEEQRFGVGHKEKLKQLKNNVDVLTLSATPIPRTLHMSMVGVKDTSLLETPPEDRFPVQTYVLEEDPAMIREAILRELGRGGQVFFVHNRIVDLDRVAGWLQGLVPDARIAAAHGQMREDELEQIMVDFMAGEYDVLVCTTIIESGLDISNVNTLIVKEANNMGLSQLYQLRGRVGRSNRLAYAYFTYRRDRILNEVAEKRLSAIREFTEFGSGFKIAMRDLEIRGAGSILGAEQHGHIAAVGFDLYCRLLEDAVREARGVEDAGAVETAVELPLEAFIPDSYVPDTNQKVELYRRIAGFREEKEVALFEEELADRFGDIPLPVKSLLRVAVVKVLAAGLRVRNVSGQAGFFRLQFSPGHTLSGDVLVKIGQDYARKIKFSNQGDDFEIKLKSPDPEVDAVFYLKNLENFLRRLMYYQFAPEVAAAAPLQ